MKEYFIICIFIYLCAFLFHLADEELWHIIENLIHHMYFTHHYLVRDLREFRRRKKK